MTEYYVSAARTVILPNGRPLKLRRGIQQIPDDLANDPKANSYGIKPLHEMTDEEWRLTGEKKPEPAPVADEEPAPEEAVLLEDKSKQS